MAARLAQKRTKPAASEVRTRTVLTQLEEAEQEKPFFAPFEQIQGKPPFKVSYPMITPEQARKIIVEADSDPEFHQRPVAERDANRWRNLMEAERFVWWLPNGPLCYDPDGMLLNGKSRMTGLTRQYNPQGFMVVSNVPRRFFPFFDTMRARTINDVFRISGKMPKSQTGSTVRLAMRYAEVVRGFRSPVGWQNWGMGLTDEHVDVNAFLDVHADLADMYLTADAIYKATKINISALMVWRYFQGLAWPGKECQEHITAFWQALHKGSIEGKILRDDNPAAAFREWSRESFYNRDKIRGKRELHLLLLNRYFQLFVQGDKLPKINWAHGWHMNAPYNPGGAEVALKNARAALEAA